MKRRFTYRKYPAVLLLLGALASGTCSGQESHAGALPETGTLNLLLANRRGFVIAADSRRTQQSSGMHWDDSQKLFRVGPMSALVVAGFASWTANKSPLDVQVASLFREEFADQVWTSGKRPFTEIPSMVNTKVGYELETIGALGVTERPALAPEQLDFRVLAAGFIRSRVHIVSVNFKPRIQLLGPFDLAAPSYDMLSTTTVADHFVALSAGIDGVARAILDGAVDTRDDRILNYYRCREQKRLDMMSLDSLHDLAVAILEATKRATTYVGGPNQIGVFPIRGRVTWELPEMATDKSQFHSTIVNVGFAYTPNGLTPLEYSLTHGKKVVTNIGVSLVQPFDEPFIQVFVGSWFRDVSVSLDGNAFAGNHFVNVTFKYKGVPFNFPSSNSIAGCILEISTGVPVPPALMPCTVMPQPSVNLDGTIGAPIRAQPKGCVTRKADGRLVVKTKGRQSGKNCKGSGVIVSFQPLGPGAAQKPQ
jgi:20S proteasome alpha/beta subunit